MRAVPYVPFYLALAGGFWKSEGLDIRHVVSPSTSRTATALLEGSVDVSWGGPMRVMMHHDADPACPLVCFGQVVARDPFLLVGRTRKATFRWHDLVGLRVAPAGDVPTPWMTFQDDLQRAGPAAPPRARRGPGGRGAGGGGGGAAWGRPRGAGGWGCSSTTRTRRPGGGGGAVPSAILSPSGGTPPNKPNRKSTPLTDIQLT